MSEQESNGKLDFYQAMRDFRTMFPSLDESLIETVLRSNRGAVDDTIDALLALSLNDSPTDASEHKIEQKTSANDLLSDFLSFDDQKIHKKIYKPPLLAPLPADFLRLNLQKFNGSSPPRKNDEDFEEIDQITTSSYSGNFSRTLNPQRASRNEAAWSSGGHFYTIRKKSPAKNDAVLNLALKRQGEIFKEKMAENDWKRQLNNDPGLEQFLEDERIALMLQNEEFLLHLKNDPDFLAALEKDRRVKRSKSAKPTNGELVDEADPFPYTKILPKVETNDIPFSEKLKYMGKNSRRKFALLARKFAYKKKGAKAIIGNSQSNYSDVRLLDGINLNDESDLLIDEQDFGSSSAAGYNQQADDNYNISHNTDLKEGRLFSTYKQ